MPDQEPSINLIQGETYIYNDVFVVRPFVSDGAGNYVPFSPVHIQQAGITLGIYLGEVTQVKAEMADEVKALDVEDCVLFRPSAEILQATGLSFDAEFVLIPIPFTEMAALEHVP